MQHMELYRIVRLLHNTGFLYVVNLCGEFAA